MPLVSKGRRRLMGEINVVPYIDVMLVLLIIFMITAPLLTQGIKVELPKAAAEPLDPNEVRNQEPLVLSIDAQGRLYLNLGAQPTQALDDATALARATAALRRAPQRVGVLFPGRPLADAEEPGQLLDAVGKIEARARQVYRIGAVELQPVLVADGVGHGPRLAVVKRVIATHGPLQLGKLADHARQQIGLREPGGAPREQGVGADVVCDPAGQQLDALDALELAAELAVIDDAGKSRNARLQPRLAVLVVEELRVREPRPQHALVAVDDLPGLFRLDIGDKQETGEQFPGSLVAQRHVFLMPLHREHQALLRHLEKLAAEFACIHGRRLDQRGDLVEQGVIGDQRGAPAGGRFQRLDDLVAPALETGDDLAMLAQRLLVVVGVLDRDRAAGQEAVAQDPVGALDSQHAARHDVRSMEHHEAVHGTHELRLAVAPPHRLRDRKLLDSVGYDPGKDGIQRGALDRDARNVDRPLRRVAVGEGVHFGSMLLREARNRLRRRFCRGARHLLAPVLGSRQDPGHERRESPRSG